MSWSRGLRLCEEHGGCLGVVGCGCVGAGGEVDCQGEEVVGGFMSHEESEDGLSSIPSR